MSAQTSFTTYLDTLHVTLGACVLRPDTETVWPSTAACRVLVPDRAGWSTSGEALAQLFPFLCGTEKVTLRNGSRSVGLTFTLGLSDQSTLLFFGSRLAGFHRPTSDVDLLVIAPGHTYEAHTHGRLSLYTVAPETALSRCARGDLFFGRLLASARPLYDPRGRFADLARAFRPSDEPVALRQAAAVGTFLLSDDLFARMPDVILPRALWCLRTVLLAEGHNPFEAAAALPEHDRNTHHLLNSVRDGGSAAPAAAFAAFAAFLHGRGLVDADWLSRTPDAWADRFATEDNPAGLKTVAAVLHADKRRSGQKTKSEP